MTTATVGAVTGQYGEAAAVMLFYKLSDLRGYGGKSFKTIHIGADGSDLNTQI